MLLYMLGHTYIALEKLLEYESVLTYIQTQYDFYSLEEQQFLAKKMFVFSETMLASFFDEIANLTLTVTGLDVR